MEEYKCKYCGRICKNANSLRNHERLCKENPNYVPSNFIKYNELRKTEGIKGENQFTKAKRLGLPKPMISKYTRDKLSKCNKGKQLSEEVKQKISETQKKNYKGKSRWYTQIQHRLSYAEQYFMKIFTDAEMHFHVDRFFLDFAWPEKKIYIEVDGEQHKLDEKIIRHDKERTEILETIGWKLITRIYWPDFSKLDFKSRKQFINDILNKIHNR